MEQGRHRIDPAAYSVGYRSGRDLARAFKQRFGIAPHGWSRAG